ncbi:hypothetical protein ACLOJK_011046 [Asimina triloba]
MPNANVNTRYYSEEILVVEIEKDRRKCLPLVSYSRLPSFFCLCFSSGFGARLQNMMTSRLAHVISLLLTFGLFPLIPGRVEVSDGSGFISISKSRVVEESSGSRAIVEESGSNESIRVEESTGGVVDVTGGNDGIGIEESDGAVLSIISSKSTGVKESDSTAAISNNTNVGEEEVPLTPFQRILEGSFQPHNSSVFSRFCVQLIN